MEIKATQDAFTHYVIQSRNEYITRCTTNGLQYFFDLKLGFYTEVKNVIVDVRFVSIKVIIGARKQYSEFSIHW